MWVDLEAAARAAGAVPADDCPCFTEGARIATPEGERAIEDLAPGDRVLTRDNGIQTIRWIGRRVMNSWEIGRLPHLRPVVVRAGALGDGLPEQDLVLSPNHRLLFVQDESGAGAEVFVAVRELAGEPGIDFLDVDHVAYVHLLCDRHEVILANGVWTESFQPGDYSLAALGRAQSEEILELFPELRGKSGVMAFAAARRTVQRPGLFRVIGD